MALVGGKGCTHITVVLFIVELATAHGVDGRGSRGRAARAFFFVCAQTAVSKMQPVSTRERRALGDFPPTSLDVSSC